MAKDKGAEVNLLLNLMLRKQHSRECNEWAFQLVITNISLDLILLVVMLTQLITVTILPSRHYCPTEMRFFIFCFFHSTLRVSSCSPKG